MREPYLFLFPNLYSQEIIQFTKVLSKILISFNGPSLPESSPLRSLFPLNSLDARDAAARQLAKPHPFARGKPRCGQWAPRVP